MNLKTVFIYDFKHAKDNLKPGYYNSLANFNKKNRELYGIEEEKQEVTN